MLRVFRCIQGEEMKSRHTLIPVLHLLFPLFGAGAFAGYFHISGWDETTNIAVFLEAIAIVIPFVGTSCSFNDSSSLIANNWRTSRFKGFSNVQKASAIL